MTDETEATETETLEVEVAEVEIPSAEELYDGVEPVEAKETEPKEEKAEETEDKTEETEAEKDVKEEVEATSAPVPTQEEQIAALTKEVSGLKGAYGAEKEKRQAAEKEKAEPIDPIDDPVAYRQSIMDETREEMDSMRWGLIKSDFNTRHPDHKDIEEKFTEIMKDKPELATKAQRLAAADPSANPLDFVLQVMKEDEKSSEGSVDIDALTAKITAEVTAKFDKDAKKEKVDEVKANIPDDLSGEASRGERKAAAYKEPTADELYN